MKLFSKRRYVNELFSKERLIESSHAEAMEAAIEEATEDAAKNTKLEIAENMLKEKIEVNLVSKTTNLSLDTILKLKNKLEG